MFHNFNIFCMHLFAEEGDLQKLLGLVGKNLMLNQFILQLNSFHFLVMGTSNLKTFTGFLFFVGQYYKVIPKVVIVIGKLLFLMHMTFYFKFKVIKFFLFFQTNSKKCSCIRIKTLKTLRITNAQN